MRSGRDFGERRAILRRSRSATWQIAIALLVATIGAAGLGFLAVQLFYLPETIAQSRLNRVPDLTGMEVGDARSLGESESYAVISTRRYSEDVEAGDVIYQIPPPGFYLPAGDTLRVLVSSGPVRTRVPDVVGLEAEQAASVLRQLGLKATPPRRAPSDVHPQGVVVETIPPVATPVDEGAAITLVLSRGGSILSMPDVRGLSLADARDTLEIYSLTVGAVTTLDEQEPSEEGRIVVVSGQEPRAGHNVRSGSAVRLELGEKLVRAAAPVGRPAVEPPAVEPPDEDEPF